MTAAGSAGSAGSGGSAGLGPTAGPGPDVGSGGSADTSGSAGSPGSAVRRRRLGGLLLAAGLLVIAVSASLAIGARPVPVGTVWAALAGVDHSYDAGVVLGQRLPRTAIGVGCGVALGLSGAIMQALTRNPLADPGLLGVNAGAAAAVVTVLTVTGTTGLTSLIWLSFLGAGVVAVIVYLVGTSGRTGGDTVTLVLTGAAIAVTLASYTSLLNYLDSRTYDQIRFWAVGSLAGRPPGAAFQVLPFLAAGLAVALALGPSLNVLALGEETATALGLRLAWTRLLSVVAVILLCGSATAVAGPVAFVGLAVPHTARMLTGPDHRWIFILCLFLAPALLVGADTVGRALTDEEFQVGVVTVWIGAPFFLALVRYRRVREP